MKMGNKRSMGLSGLDQACVKVSKLQIIYKDIMSYFFLNKHTKIQVFSLIVSVLCCKEQLQCSECL